MFIFVLISSGGNPGRAYDENVDITKALENHYDPTLALQRIKDAHEWLSTPEPLSDEEIANRGWKKGYNLTAWTEMPGELDSTAIGKLLLQNLTGGRFGFGGTGPGEAFRSEAKKYRNCFSK
jgi:hypothetical protein